MKQNYVATNLTQDFTDAEKEQGRSNIDAAKMHYINVVLGSGSIDQGSYDELVDAVDAHEPVYIVTSSGGTATYWQFKQANSSGYDFFTYGNNGMLNMHISNYRQVSVEDAPLGNIYEELWYEPRSMTGGSTNTYSAITLGPNDAWQGGVYKYNEVMGSIMLEPKHTGSIALCPFKTYSEYDGGHGAQCTNLSVTAGNIYTIPFYFHTTQAMNNETLEIHTYPISGYLGIKGSASVPEGESYEPVIYKMVFQAR